MAHYVPGIDDAYRELIDQLPPDVRSVARGLPYRLGLTHRPDGKWSDFTQLEAVHALPCLVAEGAHVEPSPYLRAHRAAGFYCVLVDRVADGQAALDRELRALRRELRKAWVASLARVVEPERAAQTVAAAERAFWRSARAERLAFETASCTPSSYARAVRDKTAWLAVASRELLRADRALDRLAAFEQGHVLLFGSLQLFDDASDVLEDREVRGRSIPDLLRVSPHSMLLASRLLTEAARDAFAGAGFRRIADWLDARARELSRATSKSRRARSPRPARTVPTCRNRRFPPVRS